MDISAPLLIRGFGKDKLSEEARRLHRKEFGKRLDEETFDEDWLQGLLFGFPSLLPMQEIEPAFKGAVPIARELPAGGVGMPISFMPTLKVT